LQKESEGGGRRIINTRFLTGQGREIRGGMGEKRLKRKGSVKIGKSHLKKSMWENGFGSTEGGARTGPKGKESKKKFAEP